MTASHVARETFSAAQSRVEKRRASALKGWRTRKHMKIARMREQQRRDDELVAEHGLVRPLRDRLLWPSDLVAARRTSEES